MWLKVQHDLHSFFFDIMIFPSLGGSTCVDDAFDERSVEGAVAEAGASAEAADKDEDDEDEDEGGWLSLFGLTTRGLVGGGGK